MQKATLNWIIDPRPKGTVRLLTAKELAAALQLNEQTVYRLARNGAIRFVRIGKKAIRFDLERVREALATPAPSFKRSPWPFVRLDDLQAAREWLKPPADVVLKRFNVPFPTKDLTRTSNL